MRNKFEVTFTRNMLDGALQGQQIRGFKEFRTAAGAAAFACYLNTAGVMKMLHGESWTAHNIDIKRLDTDLEPAESNQLAALRFACADRGFDLSESF